LFKSDDNPRWSVLPSQFILHNSYSKLMTILSRASFQPNTCSLFNSYPN
jgi:hypothetical protein